MLIRQTLRYLPAQLLSPAFQLLSMIVWTYWLQPGEMGVYVLVSATQEFVNLFALSWFSVYALRFMPFERGGTERTDYLHTEASIIAISVLVSILAAAATVMIIGHARLDWPSVAIVAFFFATRGANTHYSERARAQSDIPAYTILQVVGPILGFFLGLAFVAWIAPSSNMLLLAYGIAQLIANLIAAPLIGVAVVPRFIRKSIVVAAFSYGGPILMLFGLGWIAENNFRYIVEHMSGAAVFGLMAVGWGLGRRCASFGAMLVAAAAFPIAARLLNEGKREEAFAQLSVNASLLLGVMAPTVAGLMLIAEPATNLLIAPIYREMTIAILGLSALAGAIRFLHVHVTDQAFVLEKRIAYAAIVDIVEIVATIVLTAAGLYFHGAVGAVIGAAAGSAIAVVVSVGLAVTRMGFVVPLADLGRIAAATAVMAATLYVVPTAVSITGLVLTVLLGMVVYAAAVALAYRHDAQRIASRLLSRRATRSA